MQKEKNASKSGYYKVLSTGDAAALNVSGCAEFGEMFLRLCDPNSGAILFVPNRNAVELKEPHFDYATIAPFLSTERGEESADVESMKGAR